MRGVPAGSTITLELELLKCPAREDLFDDGGALKLLVQEGGQNARPRFFQHDVVHMMHDRL